jgi:phospholipid transport system substrate-binding protein
MQRSVVRRLVGDSMDYREISRRALGHNWDQLSDGERNDFVSDLGTLIEKRYLLNEGAVGPDLRVNFEREALTDRGTASVFGTIVGHANRKNLHIALEYRLLWRNNRWVVYDLVTDGDSLLESYRAEFDRIIARETFAGLKRRMKRAQIAEDRAEERADR